MKTIIVYTYLFLTAFNLTYSQFIQEDDSLQIIRMKYFFDQRTYPYDTIPYKANYNAYEEKMNLRSAQGMYSGVSSSWITLGPSPGNYSPWGNISGRTQSILFDPRDNTGNTIYVCEANGGLWRTINGLALREQVQWTPLTWFNLPSMSSGAITIDKNFNIIYYGTGEDIDFTSQYLGTGIYKSTNDGNSWIRSIGIPYESKVFKIVIRPGYSNSNEVLAAIGNAYWQNGVSPTCGIYRSTDFGYSFGVNELTLNQQCTDLIFDPNNDHMVYAVGPPPNDFIPGIGFRISSDGGATFSEPITNNGLDLHGRTLITMPVWESSANIYVLTGSDGSHVKIYKSTNSGVSFFSPTSTTFQTQVNYCTFVRVSPVNPDLVFVGAEGLWRSTDGGVSFTQISNGYYGSNEHVDFHNMDFFPVNNPEDPNINKMVFTSDGGVYRTTNGGVNYQTPTFENLNKTLNGLTFYKIACDPFDENKVLGAALDNGLQLKNSTSNEWYAIDGGDYANVCFNTNLPDNFIGVNLVPPSNVRYSTDGGITYLGSDLPGTASEHPPLISHPTINGAFYAGIRRVYYSSNGGQHWVQTSSSDIDPPNTVNQITVSKSNSQNIYISTWGFRFSYPVYPYQKLFRSSNGGQSWTDLSILEQGVKTTITSIQVDPVFDNEVLITISGWDGSFINGLWVSKHIYKSTDYGVNWTNITYNLPNIPVNDLYIHYTSNNKQYIIATDNGVYIKDESNSNWYELSGESLPNTTCTNLQYNRFVQKLRVGTFGIGAWEINLPGIIAVPDELIISTSVNPNNDIVISSGGHLRVPYGCTIKMPAGKKIIVQSGGQIDVPSGQAVTFTSQSGEWGGIEFQGTGYGTLSNCTFTNTTTPITITGSGEVSLPDINITGCTFTNCGPVQIDSRPKVNVQYCTWNYTSASTSPVIGVFAVNSNQTNISFNNISYLAGASFTSGIWVTYGEDLVLHQNTITNSSNGIYVGNSSPFISGNTITNTSFEYAIGGLSLVNCYSPTLKYNTVTNYQFGVWLENSSPIMYSNVIVSENTVGMANTNSAMDAEFNSNAILSVSGLGGGVALEEAGNNKLRNNQLGEGIHVNYSLPVLDYGSNTIYGLNYYIEGYTGSPQFFWYARCNNWVDNPVDPNKFVTDVQVVYDCPGGGGSFKEQIAKLALVKTGEQIIDPPPQPYIINYGHGVYDTIRFINRNMNLTQDKILFSEGSKLIYDGSYTLAISKFQQVIQNYQDSSASINSMKKIIFCYDKMNADTSQYNGLRNYYLALAQNNPTDSAFVKVATELAAKCMVRNNIFYPSITEYENIITNSSDSLQILNSELNIIQLYMIASQQGNGLFVAKYESLRPGSKMDGVRMIGSKIFPKINNLVTHTIPKEFKLYQNYPNPFNPLTKIKFELPKDVKVTIKIYDILGREVKTLVNEFRKAGRYSATFDGSNFASGVYFYRIEAGDFVDSKKMVLIK